MKNSLLLFISLWATTVFAQNPVYLDANGVTIKAHEWANVGDKGVVNGIEYIVADREMLDNALENNEPLSNYCTSRITSMNSLFLESPFNGDISSWDVSNVTNMEGMFNGSSFNGDISKWDVSNVTDMNSMFSESQFNGDISRWNVSNVAKMEWMFLASKFNGDISNWDVRNVFLRYCVGFSEAAVYDFPKPNFTNCNSVYLDANGFTIRAYEWAKVGYEGVVDGVWYTVVDDDLLRQAVEAGWNLETVCTSHVSDMSGLFLHSSFNGDISKWDVSNVTDMMGMFEESKFNGDISNWDVSNVTDMSLMFLGTSFDGDISNWDVSNVTNMSEMFSWSQFNGDISKWKVRKVEFCRGFSYEARYDFPKPKFKKCDPDEAIEIIHLE